MPDHWDRAYSAPDITVYYDLQRCIHFAACVRGLPEVFNPQTRPWIRADASPAPEIADVVRRCPTGALHYVLTSGPAETPDPPSVEVRENGPNFVRGDLLIEAPGGPVRDTRTTLCRCGASENKPFCDGHHRSVEFRAAGGEKLNSF